jgi:hypothetical protein
MEIHAGPSRREVGYHFKSGFFVTLLDAVTAKKVSAMQCWRDLDKISLRLMSRISAFSLSSQQTTAVGTVKISFSMIDPRGKDLPVKLFTTAGQISIWDNDLILDCNKLGKHKVELCVINEDYLASNSTLDLSVV